MQSDSRDNHSKNKKAAIVGGGPKKILYALQTLKKIGVSQSAKALSSKNACKACGLGMGGQSGGMTNELGEFPSVCNKSVQAQSTDIQPAIPDKLFEHSIEDFADLSAHEIEHLGRLGKPIFKSNDTNRFSIVDWDWALEYAAEKFARTKPKKSFFYSSGRSSNEAGFVLQLLARIYGTNNVNNCSYYCHQATGVGLGNSIGTGTATVELADLSLTDCIFVIGANPASNHPRFVHQLKACRDRGGQVIVINPAKEPGLVKFALPKSARSLIAGGSDIASLYIQPKIGSDLALFKGIAKALIENRYVDSRFIQEYTTGFQAFERDALQCSWSEITTQTGVPRNKIENIAKCYSRAKSTVFAWGMGITHHRHGVKNVEYISNLALMRGMIGQAGCGLLPLRGHSNVQGIGTIGVKPVLAKDIFEKIEQTLNVQMVNQKEQGLDTLACLDAAHRGEIDAALIMGGNLLQATPNTLWAREALSRIPFKLFLTTTLNKGHIDALLDSKGLTSSEAIILPVVARDEEPEPTTQESMFNFVRLSDGGIDRIAEAKSELDILADLGDQIQSQQRKPSNFNFSVLKSRKSLRKTIASVVPGMEELADIDVAKKEFHIRNRLLHKPEFFTRTGKAHFIVQDLPQQIESEKFPFRAMSVRSEGQFNSIIYEEEDSYRGIKHRWTVMISPADMRELQLKDRDQVDITSKTARMSKVEVKSFDLPKGDIMLYYPEANCLISTESDPSSKTPAFKSVAVSIQKLTD